MNIIDTILSSKLGYLPAAEDAFLLPVDHILAHDGSMMLVERLFREEGLGNILEPEKVFVAFDHIYPANSALTANLHRLVRAFLKDQGVTRVYEGRGISHQLIWESNTVSAFQIVVGGDSHTPSIGAAGALGIGLGATDIAYALLTSTVWFTRPEVCLVNLTGIPPEGVEAKDLALLLLAEAADETAGRVVVFRSAEQLPADWRFVLCNMAPEMDALSAVFEPLGWCPSSAERFEARIDVDLRTLARRVALPHQVRNVALRSDVSGGRPVDVVFIGTCTGGRLSDIATLTEVLKQSGNRLATRLVVCPASSSIYQQAIEDGHIGYLLSLGATILPPSCGPCLGQSVGILGDNEVCVSTANRNFRGRMGNPHAEIILASSRVAAECAVGGRL